VLLFWCSRALSSALDSGQFASPRPAGLNPGKVKRFPILGEAIYRAIAQDERRRMLERLYPDYEDLSSLPHGLSTLKPAEKAFYRPGQSQEHSRRKAKDSGAKDATERASIISIMSTIQCGTAFTEKYPRMSTSWPVS
jgi:hypothetical protein